MPSQRGRGARALAPGARWALVLLVLGIAACMAGVRTARPGWSAAEVDAELRCEAGQARACSELGRLLTAHGSNEKDISRGLVLLEVACGRDDAAACATLGEAYRNAGDPNSRARAKDLLTRACDLRDTEGCAALGELLALADKNDLRAGIDALRRSCDLGGARGCELYGLAEGRLDGDDDRRREEDAFALACGLGRLSSCQLLAMLRLSNPATREAGTALLARNCARGFTRSCATASVLFAPVIGAPPACAQVLPLAELACEAKDDDGCTVGDACRIEAQRDAPAALRRLRLACDRGIALACFYWADVAARPGAAEPPADPAAVQRAYERACRGRSPAGERACVRLAAIRLAAATTAAEAEPLTTFLQRACERSVGEACCTLAEVYAAGRWGPPDPARASDLRSRGCNLGDEKCCHP